MKFGSAGFFQRVSQEASPAILKMCIEAGVFRRICPNFTLGFILKEVIMLRGFMKNQRLYKKIESKKAAQLGKISGRKPKKSTHMGLKKSATGKHPKDY